MSHEHPHASDVSVRPATPDDAARMGEIQVASWRETHAAELGAEVVASFDPAQFAEAWAAALAEHGASQVHRLLVACDGPDVVGFAATQPSPDPDAADGDERASAGAVRELTALFVEPARWRQGHGSRLLAACCDLARESGATEVWCWVTGGDEVRARFLESAGFARDGAWRTSEIDDDHTLTERRYAVLL